MLIVEQNQDIGSPVRTSGGSFIDELDALGIPPHLYHPISRIRFVAPEREAAFDYPRPVMCVIDVRGTFQYLAGKAADAGAEIRLSTTAQSPLLTGNVVTGVRTNRGDLTSKLVIDATGYRSGLLKQVHGLDPGFERFGVGAEYDMHAPHCDPREALLIVGGQIAPAGYAWVFPWGNHRVRVGVGVIHPDSRENPDEYLEKLVQEASRFGVNLRGAQPLEHHRGLIPSERFAGRFAGNGILGVGDSVGQASALVGEGIRWAMMAGQLAGETAAQAIRQGDVSGAALEPYELAWRKRFGPDLRLAAKINKRIACWDDRKWNQRTELLKLLTPDQFQRALKTNLHAGWLWKAGLKLMRGRLLAG